MDYILDIYRNEVENHASSKARDDVNAILADDFTLRYYSEGSNPFTKLMNWHKVMKELKKKADMILLQYPACTKLITAKTFDKLQDKDLIFLVHDIETLRTRAPKDKVDAEIGYLNKAKVVISHNAHMTKWLKENGLTSKVVDLGIFDYLYEGTRQEIKSYTNAIAFAGNLSKEKSAFVYDKDFAKIGITLYGPNFAGEQEGLLYKGSLPSDKLPLMVQERFGLVWDGISLDECTGNTGVYLKYNNPHKTSLYLSAGMPVIVWNQAAIADFVRENHVGLCVSSLYDLKDILASLSEEEYQIMRKNAEKIAEKLRNGYYTKLAIEKAKSNF